MADWHGGYGQLRAHEVHLCLTFFDDPRLDALLPGYRGVLTDAERAQEKKFHFDADRRRYLVTRALLRSTLSSYFDVDPAAWRFEFNQQGRPRIAAAHGLGVPFDFNLSHTKGLIVLGLCAQGALGVDTENVAARKSLVHLADHYFAAPEKIALRALAPAQQQARFFEYWTLKEAYIKARGLGLSIPLDQFSFDLSAPPGIALHTDPGLDEDAARWAFWQWSLAEGHLLALCAQGALAQPPKVRLWRVLPWYSVAPCELPPFRTSRGADTTGLQPP